MVAAGFDDAAMLHYMNDVSVHCSSESMRDYYGGAANRQPAKPQQPVGLGPGIERAGWFVQNYYWRLSQESPCECHPLPLTDAEFSAANKPFAKQGLITFR